MNPLAYLAGLLADAARTLYRWALGKPEPRLSMRPEELDYPQHEEKGPINEE